MCLIEIRSLRWYNSILLLYPATTCHFFLHVLSSCFTLVYSFFIEIYKKLAYLIANYLKNLPALYKVSTLRFFFRDKTFKLKKIVPTIDISVSPSIYFLSFDQYFLFVYVNHHKNSDFGVFFILVL